MDWLGGFATLAQQAGGIIGAKETAKAQAKEAALQAQRDFELAKLRSQAEASRSAVMPGAPSEMAGNGLIPGIPTWALLGAGAALILLVVVMRK